MTSGTFRLSESHHLYLTRLQPKQSAVAASADVQEAKRQTPISATRGAGGTNNASFTADGRIICRNFNRQRDCQLAFCNFTHVCNTSCLARIVVRLIQISQHNTAVPSTKGKPSRRQLTASFLTFKLAHMDQGT